ncbi:Aste57867_3272 [Aphanomyces stellatus]|uniref:Aste57867_3272 protein n=1 Tax=Aphanomyces stellatus TaxID=120398 RepID=A0A485KBS4_9STRA|nr:hypothetical protein As57867_003262 [Aphanomyces stellatus]VFT80444.1 Aste57867_3272 [Aphanomyces stellatus]
MSRIGQYLWTSCLVLLVALFVQADYNPTPHTQLWQDDPILQYVLKFLGKKSKGINLKRNDLIVIVGGGPAGIHYATLLAQKGFTNITILEASNQIGGKTKTVMDPLGFPHELGTCYAHALYAPVFDLLKQYDPTNKLIPFMPTVKGHTWVNQERKPPVDYNTYVLQMAMRTIGPKPLPELIKTVNAAFDAYIALHKTIFGVYDYGMPPKPTNWTLVRLSGYEFLAQNKLLAIEGFFRFVFQQQGYGSLENTPAFYMLWWAHPDMIRARQAADSQGKPWVWMLSKGYKSLWQAMLDAYPQIQVKLNVQVIQTTRSPSPVYITVYDHGVPNVILADHLVMSIDLSRLAALPSDLTDIERMLFKDQTLASSFVVTLFESDATPSESVSQWWPARGVGATQGRLQLTRNSRLALFNPSPAHGAPSDPNPTDWGVNATGRQARVAYQYFNRFVQDSDGETAQKQLLVDLAAANYTNAKIRTQLVHNYFPRFDPKMLEAGALYYIWAFQGDQRTTWIGSSVSFESILDVVTYNNKLIQRVTLV